MSGPAWEDSEFYPVEQEWALLAARLGLSLFALNGVEFEPDPAAGGEVRARCACRSGFACTAIGKHPKYKGYLDSGTQGEREARMLVFAGPRNGFGVLTGTTSGVVVVDVDYRNGGDASLEAVEGERGTLPATLRVVSGSGDGFHLYFALPAGRVAVNDSAGKVLGAGVDVKGDGGMVVWPPSWHKSGGRYALDPNAPVEIAALPDDLVPVLTKPARKTPDRQPTLALYVSSSVREPQRYAQAAYERTVERVQRVQSNRNTTLNDAAFALGQLVGMRLLDADEVARALIGAAMRPDLPRDEARKTTFSGLYKGALLVSDSQAEMVARLRETQR